MHTTQDGWNVPVMTKPFGPWLSITWNSDVASAMIDVADNAPMFGGQHVPLQGVTSARHAQRIGIALAAFFDAVDDVRRPS